MVILVSVADCCVFSVGIVQINFGGSEPMWFLFANIAILPKASSCKHSRAMQKLAVIFWMGFVHLFIEFLKVNDHWWALTLDRSVY